MGMTQAQFAALLRTHPTTVSRWEADPQVVAPDAWQVEIMRAMGTGCAKQPEAADTAVAFLAAGMVGLALGALLGAAIQGETPPPRRGRTSRSRR
jgi:hypothetical protein